MTSLERLKSTLNHRQPDRVCMDMGATSVTGISVFAVHRLRQALLGDPSHRVKVTEPYQMLGEVDDALRDALGIDVMGVTPPRTMFGFENKDWKPLVLHDGTEVLVPGHFIFKTDDKGDWLIYPEGDSSVPPSGRMPKGGYFFDSIVRQPTIQEGQLNPADNLEEFGPISDADLAYFKAKAQDATTCQKGAIIVIPGAAFGDIALVPGPWMKHPKGIRDVEEWYVSTLTRRDYVYKVFERQCEIALSNIKRLAETVGDLVQCSFVTGTDFGTQRGPFISTKAYRDLYKPFHKAVNECIHRHSNWKTFIHSCGGIRPLIPEFIEAGFDILNPVQCSAMGMDARELKREYGKDLVFWGGGVDTQHTLSFGTPEAVYREVRERLSIFNEGGGFVFNTIHNIQATTPTENMLALFKAIKDK